MDVVSPELREQWRNLASREWPSTSKKAPRVRAEVIKKEIWDVLEREKFSSSAIILLESLQTLDRYLWPSYNSESSQIQTLLIVLLVVSRYREGLPAWNGIESNTTEFPAFFQQVLTLSTDSSIALPIQQNILAFLTLTFQSLDKAFLRRECASLVSISIWHQIPDAQREKLFEQLPQTRKIWRASGRRFEAADQKAQAKLKFDQDWLVKLFRFAITQFYKETADEIQMLYCQRFLYFLVGLLNQLPTRRYTKALISDLNLITTTRLSPLFENSVDETLQDLWQQFLFYVDFGIDEHTTAELSEFAIEDKQDAALRRLQFEVYALAPEKMKVFALTNLGAIRGRESLRLELNALEQSEMQKLLERLNFNTKPLVPEASQDSKRFLQELLVEKHEVREKFLDRVDRLPVFPTERELYDRIQLRNETIDAHRCNTLPRLNLQYLTTSDFLWRAFALHQIEAYSSIRTDLEESVRRANFSFAADNRITRANGPSRMCLPITRPSILEVTPPFIDDIVPSAVRAEIRLDLGRLDDHVRMEWDSLKTGDVVYLVAIASRSMQRTNGDKETGLEQPLTHVRAAKVERLLDDKERPVRAHQNMDSDHSLGRHRRLHVLLDAEAFQKDTENQDLGKADIYESINVIVRRGGRENNFGALLSTIKSLLQSDLPLPSWLNDVYLGFGNPVAASYPTLSSQLREVDLGDTFLDAKHLEESLPDYQIEWTDGKAQSAPFKLTFPESTNHETTEGKPTKAGKAKPSQSNMTNGSTLKKVLVTSYKPQNPGPYARAGPAKKNRIRWTPAQSSAIMSGVQPGLSVIVGPPGTGKTDVATQIIYNLYHNFPRERILLIAHSNQALNQLFQKITKLNIDPNHLLRLGHGEEGLDSSERFGKSSRVQAVLESRPHLLAEVSRLAVSIGLQDTYGGSCEIAEQLNKISIIPAWKRYWRAVEVAEDVSATIRQEFPFSSYFATAGQPLFPSDATKEDLRDIAQGCEFHLKKLFSDIENVRPFEVIRNAKEQENYLLLNKARIIAMTATHACIRQAEFVELGFKYHSLVMEEAAQITEMETYVPFQLQEKYRGDSRLKRIVLCGDHLQNSPIVQNFALRQEGNLEQSLFLRLIRLGVPTINLDRQGRARPSIAELYKWRYPGLGNLPQILDSAEYAKANAGLRYDWQFIDVQDYKGQGETQPNPHVIQNLGEAEYVVALYQYMRLLGYPARKISILTTYAGQRSLIRDVLNHRCARNPLFGIPHIVTTVDKYQGEQNDFVLLSMVRTKRIGYLRDIRRLTVALSRARLGLYIFGRQEVFEECADLADAFKILSSRPTDLIVAPGELYGTDRLVDAEVEGTVMTGVEHLGQYVFDMTQAKVKQLKGAAPATETADREPEVNGEAEEDVVQPEELDVV